MAKRKSPLHNRRGATESISGLPQSISGKGKLALLGVLGKHLHYSLEDRENPVDTRIQEIIDKNFQEWYAENGSRTE